MPTKRIITSQQILDEEAKKKLAVGEESKPSVYDASMLDIITRDKDEKKNFLTPEGTLLSPSWFKNVHPFFGEFALVQLDDGLWNYLTLEGKFLSIDSFQITDIFREHFAVVQEKNGRFNFLKEDGKLLFETGYQKTHAFSEGFGDIQREDDLCNFIRPDGTPLCEEWFKSVLPFRNGYGMAQRTSDSYWNFIQKDGTPLFQNWYKELGIFDASGMAKVKKNGRWNYITKEEHFLSNKWFFELEDFKEYYARVSQKVASDGRMVQNLLKRDGTLLSEKWYDFVHERPFGFAFVVNRFGDFWTGNVLRSDGTKVWKKDIQEFYLLESGVKFLEGDEWRIYTYEQLLDYHEE